MTLPSEKKILIVESHPRLTHLLERQLESLSLKVFTAMSGLGALKKAHDYFPDLIILDTSLSDMDAIEVAAGIRERWKTHRIPILAVSGFSFLKATYLGSGCNVFLSKPFTADKLVDSIQALLAIAPAPELRVT